MFNTTFSKIAFGWAAIEYPEYCSCIVINHSKYYQKRIYWDITNKIIRSVFSKKIYHMLLMISLYENVKYTFIFEMWREVQVYVLPWLHILQYKRDQIVTELSFCSVEKYSLSIRIFAKSSKKSRANLSNFLFPLIKFLTYHFLGFF